ncbi:Protein kinase-like domain [Pseudocohnilembus persalinus]|uniref:Protein kinase-like domain n=1 Tax=Pseudocohnilembus persalinus TaxID=266149 RepID=A0A0V0QTP7_PSEPJ|nr:Protein kinase-like domain [Pseudocohnilembus persalinus]|eukprot:KRX05663.1 Protein kinase-like domain [Pseudocohnilembus persalinus]
MNVEKLKKLPYQIQNFTKQFKQLELLGKGSRAQIGVYNFQKLNTLDIFAVKIFEATNQEQLDQIIQEVKIHINLQENIKSENIISFHGFYFEETTIQPINDQNGQNLNCLQNGEKIKVYIILEKADGNLYQLWKKLQQKNQYFKFSQILQITQQLILTFAELEAFGITHRDIKMENILYQHSQERKIDTNSISENLELDPFENQWNKKIIKIKEIYLNESSDNSPEKVDEYCEFIREMVQFNPSKSWENTTKLDVQMIIRCIENLENLKSLYIILWEWGWKNKQIDDQCLMDLSQAIGKNQGLQDLKIGLERWGYENQNITDMGFKQFFKNLRGLNLIQFSGTFGSGQPTAIEQDLAIQQYYAFPSFVIPNSQCHQLKSSDLDSQTYLSIIQTVLGLNDIQFQNTK